MDKRAKPNTKRVVDYALLTILVNAPLPSRRRLNSVPVQQVLALCVSIVLHC